MPHSPSSGHNSIGRSTHHHVWQQITSVPWRAVGLTLELDLILICKMIERWSTIWKLFPVAASRVNSFAPSPLCFRQASPKGRGVLLLDWRYRDYFIFTLTWQGCYLGLLPEELKGFSMTKFSRLTFFLRQKKWKLTKVRKPCAQLWRFFRIFAAFLKAVKIGRRKTPQKVSTF